jgi:hypothetical protein
MSSQQIFIQRYILSTRDKKDDTQGYDEHIILTYDIPLRKVLFMLQDAINISYWLVQLLHMKRNRDTITWGLTLQTACCCVRVWSVWKAGRFSFESHKPRRMRHTLHLASWADTEDPLIYRKAKLGMLVRKIYYWENINGSSDSRGIRPTNARACLKQMLTKDN